MSKEDKAYIVQLIKQVVHPYFAENIADLLIAHGVTLNAPPHTNADRIRAMTDEELAEFIPYWSYTNACKCGKHYVDCNNECEKCVAEWLQQPAEEVADRA